MATQDDDAGGTAEERNASGPGVQEHGAGAEDDSPAWSGAYPSEPPAAAAGAHPTDAYQPDVYPVGGHQSGVYPSSPHPAGGSLPRSSPAPHYPPPSFPPGTGEGPASPVASSPKRTHRWGLGAYLLVEVVFLGTSALVALLVAGDGPPSVGSIAAALAVPTVLAAATALLITHLRGNGPRIDLGLRFSARDVGLGFAFGFAGLVITIPASILYVAIVGQDTTSAVGEVFGDVRAGPVAAIGVFVIVVFLAPLCEEIVYRGLLWGGVERLGANRWVTAAVTTLVFALAHFEFTRTPLLIIVAIPIALARLYTGRLVAGVIAHQVNNLLPGVALMLMLLGVLPGT